MITDIVVASLAGLTLLLLWCARRATTPTMPGWNGSRRSRRLSVDSRLDLREPPTSSFAAKVVNNSPVAMIVTDGGGVVEAVNPAFTQVTGFTAREVIGKRPNALTSERHHPGFYINIWQCLRDAGRWEGEVWNRRKDGQCFPKWLSINAVRDEAGRTTNFVAFFSDVREIRLPDERILHLAFHDPLTGLPNRLLYEDRYAQAIARAHRDGSLVAVMFIDLDGLKKVNDRMGHATGDVLLKQVAGRLQRAVRDTDTVARIGGDEFAVVMGSVAQQSDVLVTAERLLDDAAPPHLQEEPVSLSVGIAVYPLHTNDAAALLDLADSAMYVAKRAGGNRYHVWEPSSPQHLVPPAPQSRAL